MKKSFAIISIFVLGFLAGWGLNELFWIPRSNIDKYNQSESNASDSTGFDEEDFDEFFFRFMYDSAFQVSRINFPLPFVTFKGEPGTDLDTTFTELEDWRYSTFYLNQSYIPVTYDNFERKLNNSDERVFMWAGVENGIYIAYYFLRIDGKWRLVREEDLST